MDKNLFHSFPTSPSSLLLLSSSQSFLLLFHSSTLPPTHPILLLLLPSVFPTLLLHLSISLPLTSSSSPHLPAISLLYPSASPSLHAFSLHFSSQVISHSPSNSSILPRPAMPHLQYPPQPSFLPSHLSHHHMAVRRPCNPYLFTLYPCPCHAHTLPGMVKLPLYMDVGTVMNNDSLYLIAEATEHAKLTKIIQSQIVVNMSYLFLLINFG